MQSKILLAHGGGGTLTSELIRDEILSRFGHGALAGLPDASVLSVPGDRVAFTTDSYIVSPLEFPGGNIGDLAVCGTVNDLAMSGATPRYLSLGLILEEGLEVATLRVVLDRVRDRAAEAGVDIVCGDTKVAPRGLVDGMYINTAGIGVFDGPPPPGPAAVRPGDAILVSGPLGRHGVAVMLARSDLKLETSVTSDVAPLHFPVRQLCATGAVRWMRDCTRGGLAMALSELAEQADVTISLDETALPADPAVTGACDLLGLDPLTVACEGTFVAVMDGDAAENATQTLRTAGGCPAAATAGRVLPRERHGVELRTRIGSRRVLAAPRGEQLPRIC